MTSHRVGPAGSLAADRAFAVALVTLWHRVSEAGGSVGFVPPVTRSQVAARAGHMVADLRDGRREALVLTRGRTLIAAGFLKPGVGLVAHTAEITKLMVDPAEQRNGLGHRLMGELLDLARTLGLEIAELSVRAGGGLEPFYLGLGFAEVGRWPGRIRVAPGDDRDEVLFQLRL